MEDEKATRPAIVFGKKFNKRPGDFARKPYEKNQQL